MIFKLSTLQGIKSGTITLAFWKWKKPGVREGSRIRTALAVIEISEVTEIEPKDITAADAVKAGFKDQMQLLEAINSSGKVRCTR